MENEFVEEIKEEDEIDLEENAPKELTETLGAMLPQIPLSEELVEYVCNPWMEDSEYIQEAVVSDFVNKLQNIPNAIHKKRISMKINRLLTNIALCEKRLEMAKVRKLYQKAIPKIKTQLKNYKIELAKLEQDLDETERKEMLINKKRIKQSISDGEAIKDMTESVVLEGFYNNRGLPEGKIPSKYKVLGAPLLLPRNSRAAARTEVKFKQLGKGVNAAAKKAVSLAMNDVRADKRLGKKETFKPIYCTMVAYKDGVDIDLYGDINDEVSAKISVHLKDGKYEEYSVMATTRNKETTEIDQMSVKVESNIKFIDSDNEEFMNKLAFTEAVKNDPEVYDLTDTIITSMERASVITGIQPVEDITYINKWIGESKSWIKDTVDWFKENSSEEVFSSFSTVENALKELSNHIDNPSYVSEQTEAYSFYESDMFLEALATSSTMVDGYKNSIKLNMDRVQKTSNGEVKSAPDNSNIKIFISNVNFWIKKAAQWFRGKAITTTAFDKVKQQVVKLDELVKNTSANMSRFNKPQARTAPFQGQPVNASTDDITNDPVTVEAADMEVEIKPIVTKLNTLGYQVKYASPGHTKLRKKEDKQKNGVYYSKLYSDARVMFKGDYNFPDAPKGWKWRTVDKKDYLDVIPKPYDEKDGSPVEAFDKWKKEYMDSLRNWVNSLPNAKSSSITKANDNTAENKKRKSEEPNIIRHESVEEEIPYEVTMESIIEDMMEGFITE